MTAYVMLPLATDHATAAASSAARMACSTSKSTT